MMSSGFRVLFVRKGISYIKGDIFPPFAFLHPLSPHTKLFILFYTSSINMASYAEDILRAAREASGPSLRDIETIRSFQSRPANKDTVSVSFNHFNSSFTDFCFPFFFRMGCPFIWIPGLSRVLCTPSVMILNNIVLPHWNIP
jgi:hypothetical protein